MKLGAKLISSNTVAVLLLTAAAVGLWNRGQHGLSLSMSYEYQVNDEASSISGDLGYSYSF